MVRSTVSRTGDMLTRREQFRKFRLGRKYDLDDKSPKGRVPIDDSIGSAPRRPPTEASLQSSFGFAAQAQPSRAWTAQEGHTRENQRATAADPLGLGLIHEPLNPKLDIIFVHGLGGTSRQTWSKNRDPNLFWPEKWLPLEPEINQARVFTFGYNAHFLSLGRNMLNISDFAKTLLLNMKFAANDKGQELEIGKNPIIFVVHSMGGLVVKKAYLLGQNDDAYKDIVKSISSVIFLATPHRGTNLAEILNRMLSVFALGRAPKQYIDELNKNSPTLQDLNEQFRHVAPNLKIASFYETLKTTVGPKKMMILEKDSAILGYPGEISGPLDADHHEVCKYSSPSDSNYISVRSVLKTLASRCRETGLGFLRHRSVEDRQKVGSLLGVTEAPDDDLNFFRTRRMAGSCEWILEKPQFETWVRDPLAAKTLWVIGPPAIGKSVLSSFVIDHLQERGFQCQFYFFRFGDKLKRSLNSCLRSIAFQIAQTQLNFRRLLLGIFDDGLKFEKMEARVIWQKLFVNGLFKLQISEKFYWVIDALDESDLPQAFLNLISTVSSSESPVSLMVVSRQSTELSRGIDRLGVFVAKEMLSSEDSFGDIRNYVENEIEGLGGTLKVRQDVVRKILAKAAGSFLWVKLAVDEISRHGHTAEDIEKTLAEIPSGMHSLYQRMEETIAKDTKSVKLAKKLLTWATCSRRSLLLEELAEGLKPEFEDFVDLRQTIYQVCGQFITVDEKTQVNMIHQTAKDYLLQPNGLTCSVNPKQAHEEILTKCLTSLCEEGLRGKLSSATASTSHLIHVFLQYASTSWPYHLSLCAPDSEAALSLITKFFRGRFVLVWIHALALFGRIQDLVSASQALEAFLRRRAKSNRDKSPSSHHLSDLSTVELWAKDLVRLVGKFGASLAAYPTSIYKLIPPFCPRDSIIYQQFAAKQSSLFALSVTGISSPGWDDCLARVHVGRDCWASAIMVSNCYFAILVSDGIIGLWNSSTCQEVRRLRHGEHVSSMIFSSGGDMLATSGFRNIKVWDVSTGRILHSFPTPNGTQVMTIAFAKNDTRILLGANDASIRWISLTELGDGWHVCESILKEEDADGKYHNSPRCMAFDNNRSQIAVAYRGWPISVWDLEVGDLVGRCERASDKTKGKREAWVSVERIVWNSVSGHLLGLYNDGCIVKWHPFSNETKELLVGAREVQCSPDGLLFATSDHNGTVKLWDFDHMQLVYQLSYDDYVRDLAFSPDCRRLYDIRGSYCNIWEPSALTNSLDTDDVSSESGSSEVYQPFEACVNVLEPITALACEQNGDFYWAGRDDGSLSLFEVVTGKEIQRQRGSMAATAIDHLICSGDDQTIVIADLSNKLTVYHTTSLPARSQGRVRTIRPLLNIKVKSGVKQLLFSLDTKHLLVVTQDSVFVWCLETKEEVGFHLRESPSLVQKWINHPLDPDKVIAFDVSGAQLYRWKDFVQLAELSYTMSEIFEEAYMSPGEVPHFIESALGVRDGTVIILEIVHVSGTSRRREKRFSLIETSNIREGNSTLNLLDLNVASIPNIERVLGVYRNMFAILDGDHWVCSWQPSGDANSVKRHFLLPRDWLDMNMLELCLLTNDGTFLYPKNGEVAVVRNGFTSGDH